MDTVRNLVARAQGDEPSANTINLLIAVLSLVFFGLLLFGLLVLLRRVRRQRQRAAADTLPLYQDAKRDANIHHLTIETNKLGRSSVIVFNKDGQPMLANPGSPPHSPDNVPEIRITFPDEQDEQGRRKSGRVVVVRVGEATVGLEPVHEEQLPAYERESKTQFVAINMDHIGGLKERERN